MPNFVLFFMDCNLSEEKIPSSEIIYSFLQSKIKTIKYIISFNYNI